MFGSPIAEQVLATYINHFRARVLEQTSTVMKKHGRDPIKARTHDPCFEGQTPQPLGHSLKLFNKRYISFYVSYVTSGVALYRPRRPQP
jgi:hypothetical protein